MLPAPVVFVIAPEVDPDNFGAVRDGHLEGGPADAATHVEYALASRARALEEPLHVPRTARRHVARAPDELEHGDHVVVVFVAVFAHA